MTFAEYNTDENFDNDKSSLDELVKIGLSEGKTSDEIKSSLSPKWQKSKKIGEFDNYVSKYSTPKAEEKKPTEEKVTDKVIEETAPKKDTVNKQTEEFMNNNNAISYTQEDAENKRQADELGKRWDARLANIDKMSQSMRNIDDHMVEQLPTFMFRRYQNGEFGDPKSGDAKLRLAHFMINGLGTALSNAGHIIKKDGVQEQSDAEKYQQTNLEQGLQNRWNKYKQETQSAIDVAKQGGMSEEAITDSIATISSNNRLQSAFNQMNERQKVFALQVLGEIGDKMGNMNDEQFVNTLMGMSAMGDSLDVKEAAGMLVYRTVKDPEKRNKILNSLGLLSGGMGGGLNAGLGGLIGGNKEEPEPNPDATLEDGTNVDSGKVMTNAEYEKIKTAADDLANKYYNGEIDEAKFRSEYGKLEAEMKKHNIYNKFKSILNQDAAIKQIHSNKLIDLDKQLETFNTQAQSGDLSTSDYNEKFEELKKEAIKYGATGDLLKALDKKKLSNEAILKSVEKNNKKKNKKK